MVLTGTVRVLGATIHSSKTRPTGDWYATDPKAVELLLREEKFSNDIWEPACGQGHITRPLVGMGYNVKSSDLYDYGFGESGIDFLQVKECWQGDIITNPPYTMALEFVQKALELVSKGRKVALFLRLLFLEGKQRRSFFEQHPPRRIYVSSSRLSCYRNGDFSRKENAIAFAWFVWEKGFEGKPEIGWIN